MLWGINGFSVGRPHNIGLKNNMLLPCPRSPNCVLSQASDAKHKIKPIYYSTSVEAAKKKTNQRNTVDGWHTVYYAEQSLLACQIHHTLAAFYRRC